MEDASEIGTILSDVGLYLQHPSPAECDLQMKYHNPHYLVGPGSEMPKLEELSLRSDAKDQEIRCPLDETSKARILRVFDTAYDAISEPLAVAPSERLATTLKP